MRACIFILQSETEQNRARAGEVLAALGGRDPEDRVRMLTAATAANELPACLRDFCGRQVTEFLILADAGLSEIMRRDLLPGILMRFREGNGHLDFHLTTF